MKGNAERVVGWMVEVMETIPVKRKEPSGTVSGMELWDVVCLAVGNF
jgi:hypothetical protein